MTLHEIKIRLAIAELCFALSILTLGSCAPFYFNPKGYESPKLSFDEAWRKTASFTYMIDNGLAEEFKSPRQFEENGGGDCEDFGAYMMYLMGGGEMACLAIYDVNGEIISAHCGIIYDGKIIEPQRYGELVDMGIYSLHMKLSYSYVMSRATEYGTRGGY